MKFGILTQYYPPEVGAPQTRLSELARHFVRRGHSVTVMTAQPNYPTGRIYDGYGRILRREQCDGVNLIRTFIYPTQRTDFLRRLTNYFSFVFSSALFNSVLPGRFDYLLVESPPLFLGLAGWWLSRLKGARLIFNVSDLWPESAVQLGMLRSQGLAFRVSAWLESLCYRKAWLVTGQSKSILANINGRFSDCRTFHLSNGADTNRFCPERHTAEARAALSKNGKCVAVYAGLHGLAQGLDQLLQAAEMLKNEAEFQFVLVGDGPEKKKLQDYAQRRNLSNIRFLDPRPASEVPVLLAAADVVLVPLKTYIPGAVPSKLYEAMATSRPVVLMASGEAKEIVQEYRAGIAIQPGDVEGLAQALRKLSADPQLRLTLGGNGRRAAEEHFDRAKIANRFINFLEENL